MKQLPLHDPVITSDPYCTEQRCVPDYLFVWGKTSCVVHTSVIFGSHRVWDPATPQFQEVCELVVGPQKDRLR